MMPAAGGGISCGEVAGKPGIVGPGWPIVVKHRNDKHQFGNAAQVVSKSGGKSDSTQSTFDFFAHSHRDAP